jgi:hypothetical protein
MYKPIGVEEGREFFPKVKNLIFKPKTEPDFFVEPWDFQDRRDCAEFRSGAVKDEIFFFVSDDELIDFLTKEGDDLYIFGAYNQVNVCQIRVRGKIRILQGYDEKDGIKLRLRKSIHQRIGAEINGLTDQEAKERYAILEAGTLFYCQINAYAYNVYERG